MFRPCERPDRKTTGQSGAEEGRGKMAAAAVAEFQRAQSLLGTDRNASIDILHSIGKYNRHRLELERNHFYAQTLMLYISIKRGAVELATFAVSQLAANLS